MSWMTIISLFLWAGAIIPAAVGAQIAWEAWMDRGNGSTGAAVVGVVLECLLSAALVVLALIVGSAAP